jgi:mannose-6-phosphate isomerase-like protein (cupin superfamily)
MRNVTCLAVALAGVIVMAMSGNAQTPGVSYFPAADVEASFAKGGTLTDSDRFRVMTATRTGGGEAEQHANDIDIFHVLEGSATFITGGTLVGAHETAPGETRGSALEGGTSLTLKAGDVITIQAGVPHWFKVVDGHVRYFVVKVKH